MPSAGIRIEACRSREGLVGIGCSSKVTRPSLGSISKHPNPKPVKRVNWPGEFRLRTLGDLGLQSAGSVSVDLLVSALDFMSRLQASGSR